MAAGGSMPAESASVGGFGCNNHLSSSYKGLCLGLIHDDACNHACLDESSDNISGECDVFQCWCQSRCFESVAAATAPIPA
ncbi:hypothetical protein HU200_018090 [Digitaria exilis]|uniref:Uncharacterized protein n=1 Tax=Digitaria exilis TaxID=1010633 RepID=A0A835F5F0_9POAL|nr:hypothetical protein HU200_018090 [Digitaria exilis]